MTFDDYQIASCETAIYPNSCRLFYPAMGLAGESGEVANKIKKIFRGDDINIENVKKSISDELGDVLWYVSALANDLGLNLGDIARKNVEKLRSRKERGVIGGSGDSR